MRAVLAVCLGGACGFSGATAVVEDADGSQDAPRGDWWSEDFQRRIPLTVTTGPVRPDRGYAGYTVRLLASATELGGAESDFADARIVVTDSAGPRELPRHLLVSGGQIDLRFKLPSDLADNESWRSADLYFAPTGTPPPATGPEGESVYLWYDPATEDRLGMYSAGRMDPWLGSGHTPTLGFAGDAYVYDTGNDGQESYRRDVDERDVYVEAQWFHTTCHSINMQSGVCVRGIVDGTGADETSEHYYCSSRAQNPNCADTDQGIYDGDVVDADNETIALQGFVDPPPIVTDQWRSQGLAAFGTSPTQLRFWDADTAWSSVGMPPVTALQASGPVIDSSHEHPMRGFAGIVLAQDGGRVRQLVIRRYTEPEPVVTAGEVELRRSHGLHRAR